MLWCRSVRSWHRFGRSLLHRVQSWPHCSYLDSRCGIKRWHLLWIQSESPRHFPEVCGHPYVIHQLLGQPCRSAGTHHCRPYRRGQGMYRTCLTVTVSVATLLGIFYLQKLLLQEFLYSHLDGNVINLVVFSNFP